MKIDIALLRKINEGITRKNTGCPDCWAEKLGMRSRTWYHILNYLKTELQAPIDYCKSRQTYHYTENWDLYIGDINRVKTELVKKFIEVMDKAVAIAFLVMLLF